MLFLLPKFVICGVLKQRGKLIFKEIINIHMWRILSFVAKWTSILKAQARLCFEIKAIKSVVCMYVFLLYVPSQQLWSLRDGQFT